MSEGVVIGVLCADLARFTNFQSSLVGLETRPGTVYLWAQGADIAGQCNELCEYALNEGRDLWIMGDDHTFDPGILRRLDGHGKDVIVPLCYKRSPPYTQVIYSYKNSGSGNYIPAPLPEEGGLLKVRAAGSAGMLIRHHVLEAVGNPWFEVLGPRQNEDLVFCDKVTQAGFDIWCDTDEPLGHVIVATVRPRRGEDGWETEMDFGANFQVRFMREQEHWQPTPGGEGAIDVPEPQQIPVTVN